MSFKKRTSTALPVSQGHESNEESGGGGGGGGGGLRRRLSSLTLKIQPGAISSTPAGKWAFQRSKSLSSMGEHAGSSLRKWWEWGWSWILSRKPVFAHDLEMNEEDTNFLGCHNYKGSWRHVFFKLRSEIRKLINNKDKVGLPQTCRYNSYDYSKNFDDGIVPPAIYT